MSDLEKYKCSFCGEKASKENPIITGGKTSICKKCVGLASEILENPEKKVVKVLTLNLPGETKVEVSVPVKSPAVTLSYVDISEIANDINNEMINNKQTAPSQGYMEYLLCKIIRDKFNVNFFECATG